MKRSIIIFVLVFLGLSNNTFVLAQGRSAVRWERSYREISKAYGEVKAVIERLEKEIDKIEGGIEDRKDRAKTVGLVMIELKKHIRNKENDKKIRQDLRRSLRDIKKQKAAYERESRVLAVESRVELAEKKEELQEALNKKEALEIELPLLAPVGNIKGM